MQASEADIGAWVATGNDDPGPFTWAKTADEVIDSRADHLAKISVDNRTTE